MIAIGIISFAMIPLIGLIGISLKSVQQSRDDTIWVGIAQERIAALRVNPAPGDYFHDVDGAPVAPGSPGVFFASRVTQRASPPVGMLEAQGGAVTAAELADTLRTFDVRIEWPASAPEANREFINLPVHVSGRFSDENEDAP